jgi:glycosyltransferase involved in cell wall biosynthesis
VERAVLAAGYRHQRRVPVNVSTVSVLVCTYNRAKLLGETLDAMQAMTPPPDCAVEIVVVDNNSRDETPDVIARASRTGPFPIVALTETRQGKSFALNAGLARSAGDVVALTDDDVLPASDWLSRIVRAFRDQEIAFVFGKVLPRWSCLPPPQLLTPEAQRIWGPLAIVDYGDAPAAYLPDNTGQRLPIGANLAFSRAALGVIGGWRTDLGKVNNTLVSGEDHEIFMRLRRFGLYSGLYDPEIVVRHFVPPDRLTRQYFRRWFYWHGKTQALMLADLYPELDMARVPKIAGIPRFMIRQATQQLVRWVRTLGRLDALSALSEELHAIEYAGLFAQCWRLRGRPAVSVAPAAPERPSCGAGLAARTADS